MAEEQVRFRVTAESELPKVLNDLEKLVNAQVELGNQGDKMSKKMQDAYRTQSLAIRDLTDTVQKNFSTLGNAVDTHSGQVKKIGKEYDSLDGVVRSVRNQLIAAFGISEIKDYATKIFELTATWEKYNAALTVGLGSQKAAAEALNMLQKYADLTNFELDELTDTFTKFANRGVVLGQENLTRLGDVANALQKPFQQLGEAILDINNTERWNELGIKAKTNGDKVALTFKGVTLEVDRTEQAVMLAITAFGTMNGVAGQTDAQAKTLSGRLSTLKDNAAGVGRTIGKEMTPAFGAAIDASSEFLKVIGGSESALTRTVNWIKTGVAGWLSYKAVLTAVSVQTALSTTTNGALNLVLITLKGTTEGFTRAQVESAVATRSAWAAMATNPIGIVIGLVGTLITSYQAYKAVTTEVNVEVDAATEALVKEKVALTAAITTAQSYSAGTTERKTAIEQLKKQYPGLLDYIDSETISNTKLNKVLEQQIKLLDAKIKAAAAEAHQNVILQKQTDLRTQQIEIVTKLRGAYKGLSEAFPDNDKFVAEIEKMYKAELSRDAAIRSTTTAALAGSFATTTYSKETANYFNIAKQVNDLEKQLTIAIKEKDKATTESTNAQVQNLQKQQENLKKALENKKIGIEDFRESYKKLEKQINDISGKTDEAVRKENERWAKQSAALVEGSGEYVKKLHEHIVNLEKINGTYNEVANNNKKEGAKKSAAEIALIDLQSAEKTFENRKKIIEKTAEVEIDLWNEKYKKHEISEKAFNVKVTEISKAKNEALKKLDEERLAEEKLNAAALQRIQLEAMEKTYTVKREIIENNATIEIQEINRSLAREKISREEATKQIEEIERKKVAALLAIKLEEDGKIEELTKKLQASVAEINERAGKEVVKIDNETVKQIIAGKKSLAEYTEKLADETVVKTIEVNKEILEIEQDTAKIRRNIVEREANDTHQILAKWVGSYSDMAGQAMSVFYGTQDAQSELETRNAAVAEAQSKVNQEMSKSKLNTVELAKAQRELAKAQDEQSKAASHAGQMNLALAQAIMQAAEAIKSFLVGEFVKAYDAIIQATGKARDAMIDFYDNVIKANQDAMSLELENFAGTWEEKERIMKAYFANEAEMIANRDRIDVEMSYQNEMLTVTKDTTSKIASAWDMSKGPLGPMQLLKVFMAFKEHNAQIQAAAYEREAYEQQLRQRRIEEELNAARQIRDANIQAIQEKAQKEKDALEARIEDIRNAANTELDILKGALDSSKEEYRKQVDAVKDAYSQQLAALKERQSQEEAAIRATFELKQQLLQQETNDEIEAVAIIDRLRNEALERYRVDEVARLTATRDRILATLSDEAERAAVITEYDRQIKGVHDEVEEAKLDKSKGVSLATKQLRQEEKDASVQLKKDEKTELELLDESYQKKFKDLADDRDAKLKKMSEEQYAREQFLQGQITQLETDTATKIQILKDEIANKDKQTKDAMTFENQKYRDFVIQANKDMLESQKAMAIAQIQAEIAILKGKRNIFNSGRINAAIGDMEQAIRDLEGIGSTPMDFGNAVAEKIKNAIIVQLKANKTPFNSETLQVVNEAFDRDGNAIKLTYTDEDREFIAFDSSKKAFKIRNATGFVEKTGERYAKGTTYLKRGKNPVGEDTIPIWANEGERIIQTHLNAKIGPHVPNEKVVDNHLKMEQLKRKFPSVRIEEFGLLNFNIDTNTLTKLDTKDLESKIDNLISTIKNKNEVKIDIDAYGISITEIGRERQNEIYYQNIYNK